MKRSITLRSVLLGSIIMLRALPLLAQAGANDPTFNPADVGFGNGDGIAPYDVNAQALQPDGRVILGGEFTHFNGSEANNIVRLNADGSRDASFVTGTGFDPFILALALQPDGKVLAAGPFTNYNGTSVPHIARLNNDGSLDATFNAGTGPDGFVHAIALQADGKMIIGGAFDSVADVPRALIARLNADGSLDPTFDPGIGFDTGEHHFVTSLALQSDGRVLVGGGFTSFDGVSRNLIARLNADGSLDASYDPGTGFQVDQLLYGVRALALQPDGKVVVGGSFTGFNGTACSCIARLNTNGSMDVAYDPGTGCTNPADPFATVAVYSLAMQADGRVLVGGSYTSYNGTASYRISRLNDDASLDASFDPGDGCANSSDPAAGFASVYSFSIEPDGQIIVGGYFTHYDGQGGRGHVTRVNADGTRDAGFNAGSGSNGAVFSVALQPDGKIIATGEFTAMNGASRNRIARLNGDGSLDPSFDPGSGIGTDATPDQVPVEIAPDGKIYLAGWFDSYNGIEAHNIARLNSDGSLDADWTSYPGFYGNVNDVLLLPDGKLIMGGDLVEIGGMGLNRLVRLAANGALDYGDEFNINSSPVEGYIQSMAIQADGKLLVGGMITWIGEAACSGVARLNTDGSNDLSFDTGTGVNEGGVVVALVIQPDGRIILAGDFTSFNGSPCLGMVRLLADGSVDATFNVGAGAEQPGGDPAIKALVSLPSGKMIVGGRFSSFNGVGRNGIVRLNSDGSVDTLFDPGSGFEPAYSYVRSLALEPDGRVIAAGDFIAYDGTGRNRIARILGDAACIPSQLTTIADPVISCGAVNLKLNGTSTIAATEVPGANKYQFRFTNIAGQPAYARNISFPTRSFTLVKWATNPLKAGRTYNVQVRASFDNGGTWCDWGPSCTIKISWTPLAPGMVREAEVPDELGTPELLMYPNPNQGEQVHVTFSGFDPSVELVSIDLFDLSSQSVMTRTIPATDGIVDQLMDLNTDIPNGLYTVKVTAGDFMTTQRLIVQR